MRVFAVFPKDLKKTCSSYWDEDRAHCSGCGWNTTKLWVLANSQEEAVELVNEDKAGLCGECFMEMVHEEGWEIVANRTENKEEGK